MNKIGWGQLGIVLALSRIFNEAANFPRDDINYGMQRFTVIFLSFLLLGAVLTPVYILLRRFPGENAFTAAAKKSPLAAKLLAVVYLAALLPTMITTTVQLEFYASSTIFDSAPAWVVILFTLVICLYGTLKGFPAVTRTGVIVAGGFAVLLILVILGVAQSIRLQYLSPALAERTESLLPEVIGEFSKNAEAAIFIALCGSVREKAHRSLIVYFALSFCVLFLMTFLYNTVLGEYLDLTSFPFYRLASLSDVSLFQRLDGIDAAVWTTTAIVKLSLTAAAVKVAVESAFGNRLAARITAVALLVLSSVVSVLFSSNTVDFLAVSRIPQTGVLIFVTALLIPLAAVLFALSATEKKKRSKRV
ncbi:MAG: spore germination protein [Bacteroides sp.]|nr:spore germination protein [Eubacterium sp.]MCM1419233.1 spore germination protein [Roseburia sp.]MCM1463093.1 spore germination protein [Bacteroides sp.]